MKIRNMLIGAAVFAVGGLSMIQAETSLPKVTILGKTFYYYESGQGESLSDIAGRFGWDENILRKTNSEVGKKLEAGTLLYYPANKAVQTAPESKATPIAAIPAESKETPSKLEADGYAYHTIESGESLYGIARRYSTTIENLFRLNPGLSAGTPKSGEKIRVAAKGIETEVYREVVEEKHVDGLSEYKVKRGDSWESVAEAHNIPTDILKQANPDIKKLNRGDGIYIPVVSTVKVEKEFVAEDPRAQNSEGILEIYNEVHALPGTESGKGIIDEEPSVGVAIVLTDIGTTEDEKRSKKNKEMEFSRGALKAMDDLRHNPFKTRLTIIDGSLPADSVKVMLDDFQPSMLVSTSDTDIPEYLLDYSASTSTMLVNAFSLKDESYVDNPNLLQYMTPSSYMNTAVAEYFASTYPDYQLLVAGSPEASDNLGNMLIQQFMKKGNNGVVEVTPEDIDELELEDGDGKYLIYATPVGMKDVQDLLEKISVLRNRNLMADIRVVGRPNWIALVSSSKDNTFKELLEANYVAIPSRFYFDPEEYATGKFIDDYKSLFHIGPMKASPVYCATAYDIMTYFVPNLANHNGDFNATFTWHPTIQSPISLQRVSNWGGIVNKGVFMINYSPIGLPDKKLIPST